MPATKKQAAERWTTASQVDVRNGTAAERLTSQSVLDSAESEQAEGAAAVGSWLDRLLCKSGKRGGGSGVGIQGEIRDEPPDEETESGEGAASGESDDGGGGNGYGGDDGMETEHEVRAPPR